MVRRVVLAYAQGRLAGLRQIIGTEDQLPSLPAACELIPLDFLDHQGFTRLARTTPRILLFEEVVDTTASSPTATP